MLWALFASALLAATWLPLGSEALFLWMVHEGDYPLLWLVAAASTGNVLGSLIGYGLGRLLWRCRERSWFPVPAQGVERAGYWFRRYGTPTLLLAWLPVVGDLLPTAAGVARAAWLPVLLFLAVGKVARYALLAYWLAPLSGVAGSL